MRVHLADFHNQFPVTAGFQARRFETALVEMADANWWPPDKKIQSEIRKAEREGVQPISFDPGRHMAEFLQLMTHTEQRHGRRPKYPAAFFERLARLAEQDERVAWRVVEHDGRLAASHIYLQSGRQLLNWQVYFDKQYSFLKPNQCLLFHAARTAAARGLRYLNLGATPNDAVSLADYKRKWGGAEYRYPCLVRESWLGRLL
jgi:lipid II:glycine glycyltransferase (peptidoglycan interpeptide bridge formation enzyme)